MQKKRGKKEKAKNREDALMRIVVAIVSGIIFYFWMYAIFAFFIANLIYTLINGEKSLEISNLCVTFNKKIFDFWNYITFNSDEKPFPFENLNKKN